MPRYIQSIFITPTVPTVSTVATVGAVYAVGAVVFIYKNKKRRYLSTCALFQRAADGSRTHVLSLEG